MENKVFEELNNKLDKVKKLYREKMRRQSILDDMENRLKAEKQRFGVLSDELTKENDDVVRLEGLSFASLFHTILGDKESQLDKERQELLTVKLKHEVSKKNIESLEYDIEEIRRSLNSLSDVEENYHELMKNKEKLILQSQNENKKALLSITDEIGDLQISIKELNEAISAGRHAHREVDLMLDKLRSAEGWGTWDMFGGGLIATAAKHSNIDEAGESAIRLQGLLNRFNSELRDVEIDASDVNVNISSFDRFADFFFDGLISDWIVQSKIKDSLTNAENTKYKLGSILKKLEQTRVKQEEKLQRLLKDKQNMIEDIEME